MLNQKVILDNQSFKALSAESRVGILKNLNVRRMTLSELSKKLELESSTIKEHCMILAKADLIKQIDEGRKWKYYELTGKGKSLLEPNFMEEAKVLIVLCFGLIVFGAMIYAAFGLLAIYGSPAQSAITAGSIFDSAPILSSTKSTSEVLPASIESAASVNDAENKAVGTSSDYGIKIDAFSGLAIFTLIFGIIIGIVFQRAVSKPKF
ncbi:MAG: winged helix-turn-helix domain-containing protein [archaeon]